MGLSSIQAYGGEAIRAATRVGSVGTTVVVTGSAAGVVLPWALQEMAYKVETYVSPSLKPGESNIPESVWMLGRVTVACLATSAAIHFAFDALKYMEV